MRNHEIFKKMKKILTGIINSHGSNRNSKLIFNFIVKGLKYRKQLRKIFQLKKPSTS